MEPRPKSSSSALLLLLKLVKCRVGESDPLLAFFRSYDKKVFIATSQSKTVCALHSKSGSAVEAAEFSNTRFGTRLTMLPGQEIRILIADDHPIIREGLTAILTEERDMKVIGHARDGIEACLLCDQLSPDILMLDLRMPKRDGLAVIHELMQREAHPLVIVLTTSEKTEDLAHSLAAGARGYLLKGAEADQVRQTIRDVFAGKSSLPPDVAAKLADSFVHPRLSQREFDVLEQIARGKSNKEIGQLLYLSEHTVKNYVKAILKKLNASGRTEAIATAVRRGLITME